MGTSNWNTDPRWVREDPAESLSGIPNSPPKDVPTSLDFDSRDATGVIAGTLSGHATPEQICRGLDGSEEDKKNGALRRRARSISRIGDFWTIAASSRPRRRGGSPTARGCAGVAP